MSRAESRLGVLDTPRGLGCRDEADALNGGPKSDKGRNSFTRPANSLRNQALLRAAYMAGSGVEFKATPRMWFCGSRREPSPIVRFARSAAHFAGAGAVLHVLKSASDTVGSFFRNATIDQSSGSGTSIAPKLGMPVMLMPFLITQNS